MTGRYWIARRALLCAAFVSVLFAESGLAQTRGGTLVAVVQPEPTVLTSAFNTQFPTGIVSVNVFDGLVSYDETLKPRPSLAERWEIAEDGTSMTFHLRRGVKWHDGKDFTSADVRFSMLEIWKKAHPRGRVTFAAVQDVETPDPYTAVFKLSQPSLVVLSALNSMEAQILPKHLYENTEGVKNPYNLKPIGTGPFRFKEWKKGEYIELEKNPDYWDAGKPYLDRVIFRIIPDAGGRAAAFETGEVQYGPYSPVSFADVERLKALPNVRIGTRGYEWTSPYLCIEWNLRHPVLQKPEVRRALAHAIDRKGLVDTVWYGLGKPATSPVPSSLTNFFTADTAQYAYDPARAEKLLDEAGLPRDASGKRFSIRLDFMPYGETYRNAAEYVRQNLRRVGVEATVVNQELAAYLKRIYGGYDFDANLVQFSVFLDPQIGIHRQFWSKAAAPGVPWTIASGYSNPKTDAVVEASQREADPLKRAALFHDLQKIAMTDLPVLPLVELSHFTIYSSKLKGVSAAADGALASLKDVWLEQ